MATVTFLNQPWISPHEVDRTHNERRRTLPPMVRDLIAGMPRFAGRRVEASFAQSGVSSLVCLLSCAGERFVLKVPLGRATDEALFLRVWERAGVSVPHVFEDGEFAGGQFTLMEFVDAPTLREAYGKNSLVREGKFAEMGRTLRRMHRTAAPGFGKPANGVAPHRSFGDWLVEAAEKAKATQGAKLLDDGAHGSFEAAASALGDFVSADGRSVYCHHDFAFPNVFATKPLTPFDPDPMFNHPYVDLGRAMVIAVAHTGLAEAGEQLRDGYAEGQPLDARALHAAIVLEAYLKFRYWSLTAQAQRIANIQAYLAARRHLLA